MALLSQFEKLKQILFCWCLAQLILGCKVAQDSCWPDMRADFTQLHLLHDSGQLQTAKAEELRISLSRSLERCASTATFSREVTTFDIDTTRYTTLLDIAIASNNAAMTREMVGDWRSADASTFAAEAHEDGQLFLHVATYLESPDSVAALLEAGFNPNVTDDWGFTALHTATTQTSGGLIGIRLLVSQGANLEATGDKGITPVLRKNLRLRLKSPLF